MLILFKNDNKQHLSKLASLSNAAIIQICKIALISLESPIDDEIYAKASQKLAVEQESIVNMVRGAVNLLVEGCRTSVTENDFNDSIVAIGFNDEQANVLTEFYRAKRDDVRLALKKYTVTSPTFHDFHWRFDVEIASRRQPEYCRVKILVEFVLTDNGKKERLLLQMTIGDVIDLEKKAEAVYNVIRSRKFQKIQRALSNC